ncbi:hypothetical protein [Mycobacterium aquaticum]|uniref:Uncharacterized protein n=1 Tax=Mycobacterium aquaticum TaxID=1927124 RepID=A0A1X0A7H2_9MYCO|nr:hypothetical protein [Mycobacterium aquaticum]ORA26027.1 hypothetical protein BST13_32415 [Mycobacterium aquaticum]
MTPGEPSPYGPVARNGDHAPPWQAQQPLPGTFAGHSIPPSVNPWPTPLPAPAKPPPRKLWYAIAAALALVGIALVATGVGLLAHTADSLPGDASEFQSGESTTVALEPGVTQTVFVHTESADHSVRCQFHDKSGGTAIDTYQGTLTINGWQAALTVSAKESGKYAIRCSGEASDRFRIGENPGAGGIFGGVAGIIVGGGLIGISIIAAVVVALLRRRRPRAGP